MDKVKNNIADIAEKHEYCANENAGIKRSIDDVLKDNPSAFFEIMEKELKPGFAKDLPFIVSNDGIVTGFYDYREIAEVFGKVAYARAYVDDNDNHDVLKNRFLDKIYEECIRSR